ncbi:tetratricopeptide repeat protein [bacterium]|nr:tetratricopeptide repeat protein [bacterium]MBU1983761.1 tetratricopeptide repeat protein [bacterium]
MKRVFLHAGRSTGPAGRACILFVGLVVALLCDGCGSARYSLAKRYIRQEQYDLARRELASVGPRDAQGWALLATCSFYEKDYPALADAATHSLAMSQEFRPWLSYYLQQAFIEQLRGAVKAFQNKSDLDAIREFSQALVFSEAIDEKMKRDIVETRERIKSLAAAAALRLKDYPQAQTYLESLSDKWKEDVALLERLATAYYHMGKHDRCVATCETILSKSPGHSNALALRAQALAESGKGTETLNAYRDARSGNIRHSLLERNIGLLLYNMQDWQPAREHLQRTLEAGESKNDSLLIIVAECCYQAGDYESALQRYQQASRLRPSDPEILRALGACYGKLGDDIAARAAFTEAASSMVTDSVKSKTDESKDGGLDKNQEPTR